MLYINYDDLETGKYEEYYMWEGKPFTGIGFDLHKNGQIASEIEIVDGFEEGTIRKWYPSGKIRLEGYGRLGERYSWSKEWFENGNLKCEILAEYHVLVKKKVWNEQGEIVSEYERPSLDRDLIESSRKQELRLIIRRKEAGNHPLSKSEDSDKTPG